MENRGYSIYEVGILGGNDKGETKFILFYLFELLYKLYGYLDYKEYIECWVNKSKRKVY